MWQVKGLGVAGQGQALTFPSNMATEEPGRETSQGIHITTYDIHIIHTFDLQNMCIHSPFSPPVVISHHAILRSKLWPVPPLREGAANGFTGA